MPYYQNTYCKFSEIRVYYSRSPDSAVAIHYHVIGAFIVPKPKDIPETAILIQTRKGVAVRHSPELIACWILSIKSVVSLIGRSNPMMNNIRSRASETVNAEVVFT